MLLYMNTRLYNWYTKESREASMTGEQRNSQWSSRIKQILSMKQYLKRKKLFGMKNSLISVLFLSNKNWKKWKFDISLKQKTYWRRGGGGGGGGGRGGGDRGEGGVQCTRQQNKKNPKKEDGVGWGGVGVGGIKDQRHINRMGGNNPIRVTPLDSQHNNL